MIHTEDVKNINQILLNKLNIVYKTTPNKSFLQDPNFIILDDQNYTCFFYENNNKIEAYCFVKESYFSKFNKIKSCLISFGVISQNDSFEELLFDYIISFYKKKNFTDITIDFLLNTFPNKYGSKYNLIEETQFNRGTLLIDLTIDFESIYKNFSTLLKKNYKKGINSNLIIKELTEENEFADFLHLHIKLSASRNIDLITEKQIIRSLHFIKNKKSGIILGCFKENQMIGGVACIAQGKRIEYYLGVSDPAFRKLPLSHLTLIRAIEKAKEKGFDWFDMGGVILDTPPENQIHNITNFKLNFSSNFNKYYPKSLIKLNVAYYNMKTIYLGLHKVFSKLKSF